MKTKITTIIIIILLIAGILGGYLIFAKKDFGVMISQRENNQTTNVGGNEELEGKIESDLQGQELEITNKINSYISNIYNGLNTSISEFDDINSADEDWIWECAYSNLHNVVDEDTTMIVKKEQIEESAKQIFGDNLQKEFPKEGLEFWLEPESDGYFYARASIEKDFYNDYALISYKINDNIITANIVEYKYNEIFRGEPTELNLYKTDSEEIVKSYSLNFTGSNERYNDFLLQKCDEAEIFVKDNAEIFSIATITLEYDEKEDTMYVKSFERNNKDSIQYIEMTEANYKKYNTLPNYFRIQEMINNENGTITIRGRVYQETEPLKITKEQYEELLEGKVIDLLGYQMKANKEEPDNGGYDMLITSTTEDKWMKFYVETNIDGSGKLHYYTEDEMYMGTPFQKDETGRFTGTNTYLQITLDDNLKCESGNGSTTLKDECNTFNGTFNIDNDDIKLPYLNDEFNFENGKCVSIKFSGV